MDMTFTVTGRTSELLIPKNNHYIRSPQGAQEDFSKCRKSSQVRRIELKSMSPGTTALQKSENSLATTGDVSNAALIQTISLISRSPIFSFNATVLPASTV
jgi:hypothetical protein